MNPHLERALVLIDLRPDAAVREINQALAEEPEDSFAHAVLALCLLELKDGANALREAKESLRLGADEAFNFYVLARCHFDADRLIEAEVAIEEAIELDPFDADNLRLLALIQLSSDDLKSALASVERALENDANNANCHNLRGYILNRMGKSAESDLSANAALSLEPDGALTHAMRGWTLIERHQYGESLPHFREALRLSPDFEWAREGLIKALPSQHWIFKLHLKLKHRLLVLLLFVWLGANFYFYPFCSVPGYESGLLILLCLSWLSLLIFALILFLPDAIISGPILKFLLQFEPDGRHVLSPNERRVNNHGVLFLSLGIVTLVVGACAHVWYPLGAVLVGFCLSRLFVLNAEERTINCWLCHVGGAAFSGLIIWFVSAGGEANLLRGLRTFAFINILKVVGGGKLLALVAGAIGLGHLAEQRRNKKKDEARKKMLEDI